MKALLLLTFSLFCTVSVFSQDVIFTRDGDKIEAKVVEITSTTIKYKNFDQQDGPIRNIEKSAVKEIIYEDGQWDKFDEKESKVEKETNEDKNEDYSEREPKDPLFGNGFFLDGIIGYVMSSQNQEYYNGGYYDGFGNYVPATTTTAEVKRDYIAINVRLGHKWYFGSSQKWRPGVQATWARIGVFIAPDITDYSPKFTLSLLNVGFANVFKFSENNGMEANANVGFTMNGIPLPGLGNTPDTGIIYGAEIKYRHKALAVGIDFSLINLSLSQTDRTNMSVIGLTAGFKM